MASTAPTAFESEFQPPSRLDVLHALALDLRAFSENESREDFSRLFKRARQQLEFSDDELARMLKVSRPTIGRWARNEFTPASIVRKPVLELLAKKADAKAKTIQRFSL